MEHVNTVVFLVGLEYGCFLNCCFTTGACVISTVCRFYYVISASCVMCYVVSSGMSSIFFKNNNNIKTQMILIYFLCFWLSEARYGKLSEHRSGRRPLESLHTCKGTCMKLIKRLHMEGLECWWRCIVLSLIGNVAGTAVCSGKSQLITLWGSLALCPYH